MPLLPQPDYRPPFPFTNGHIQTIYPTLFRTPPQTSPYLERIETDDGDFLDIDWHYCSTGKTDRLAVLSHGLEGNARKKYMLGMSRHLSRNGWDVVCLNFRGCSGEPNRLPRLYHSGVTDDLHSVLTYALDQGAYTKAALIGFSMGGNQTLKYLGEDPAKIPAQVVAAVAFSVPCMLADSVAVMDRWNNRQYMHYFMHGLREKVRIKNQMFPGLFDLNGLDKISTFGPFDDRYTGPLHGFKDGADYYARCSSRQFLADIKIPTLLVQAENDPFLSKSCYPVSEAEDNADLFLEIPQFGGHVGFVNEDKNQPYWMEKRCAEFLESQNSVVV